MKKITLGIMAITLTVSAMAQTDNNLMQKDPQQKNNGFNRHGGRENYDQLNLTDAQKTQIKTINEDFRQQMKDLNKQGNITVDEQKQKRQELVKQQKDKVAAILTPEQKTQAASLSKGFKGERNGGHGDRMANLTKDLNLSVDQTAKMTSINSALKSNMQSIRQNSSLTEDQKKEQMKSLMKQHKSDVEALLTNDQKEQLKSRMKNRTDRSAVK